MQTNDIKAIAKAWIDMWSHELETPERDQYQWVLDFEHDATHLKPELALQLVTEVLKLNPETDIIEVLAAGPLEDLLSQHGESMIADVEMLARDNPQFASLLGGVWQQGMSDEVWVRVQKVWDRRGWDGF